MFLSDTKGTEDGFQHFVSDVPIFRDQTGQMLLLAAFCVSQSITFYSLLLPVITDKACLILLF